MLRSQPVSGGRGECLRLGGDTSPRLILYGGSKSAVTETKQGGCVDARDDNILKKKIRELDERFEFLENDELGF